MLGPGGRAIAAAARGQGGRALDGQTQPPSGTALRRWLAPGLEWAWLLVTGGLEVLNRVLVPVPVWVLIPVTYSSYWLAPLVPSALWGLLRRRPRRHLGAILGTVVWAVQLTAAAAPWQGDPDAVGLRVTTWNVQRGYAGADRVEAIISAARPDVVALQEVGRPDGSDTDVVARLEAGGLLSCAYRPYYEDADSAGVALCVGPEIQLLNVQRRTYHSRGRWSYLLAEVVVDGRTVNVIVPHLVAFAISEVDPVRDHRRVLERLTWASRWHHHEAEELLRQVAGFRDPTIMAGDFNSAPGLSIHRRIRARMTDAFAAAGRGFGATFSFGLPLRIDYIYLSRDFTPLWAEVGAAGASDHRPVTAVVRLEPVRPGPTDTDPSR